MADETSLREILPELVEQLTRAPRDHGLPRPRPVLVLEGCGGSGRTGALLDILDQWQDRTYVERLTSREWESAGTSPGAANPMRPLMIAIMVWLGKRLPGFRLTRMRMLVAHIAINTDFTDLPLDDQLRLLDGELDKYCDPQQLRALLEGLTRFVTAALPNPPPPLNIVLDAATTEWIAKAVPALVRKAIRRKLDHAVTWFGHRDLGLRGEPGQVLVELSNHARRHDPIVRRGVDDMLTGALLADLRESAHRLGARTPDILLLLDDGDLPMATAFTLSLLRVRELVAAAGTAAPDPLTLITTSSGALTTALHQHSGHRPAWPHTEVRTILFPEHTGAYESRSARTLIDDAAPVLASRSWLRAELTGFTGSELLLRANAIAPFHASTIAANLERLTHRHDEATELALQKIAADHSLWSDIDRLLSSRIPLDCRAPAGHLDHTVDPALDTHLLHVFASGLDPATRPAAELLEALITVSAARNLPEALSLFALHDHDVIATPAHPLYTCTTLWIPDEYDRASARMHPLARYLGLRALAARTDPKHHWDTVFGLLRERCDPADTTARLCCDRMLRRHAEVIGELAEQHARTPWQDWTALLSEVVATPDPHPGAPHVEDLRRLYREDTREWHIATLLAALPRYRDPCTTDAVTRDRLRRRIERAETFLADPDTVPSRIRIWQ